MLNTKELIENLTGKNKAFIKRVDKQQRERYGNEDIFDAVVDYQYVTMDFGDYSITFFFDKGEVVDTLGNGQGHKYHKSLEACAIELHQKREQLFPYCL